MNSEKLDGYAEGDEPLVFHYNRAERLASAPQIVRDSYAGKLKPPKGFIKVLVATPMHRVMLFSIIALCAITYILSNFAKSPSEDSLGDVPVSLSAFAFGDTIYVSISLGESARYNSAVPITAEISVIDKDRQHMQIQKLEEIYQGKEEFIRTTIQDYDILAVEAALTMFDDSALLTTTVVHK